MKKIVKLAVADFKIIFRDPSLRSFLALPILLYVLIIWLVPFLVSKYDFLEPYLPLFLVVAVIENTQLFSFVNSMVLIDEKETHVAKTYGVVPLSKLEYLVSRFCIPYLFTVFLNLVLFMVQPFYDIAPVQNILISCLAALVVPVYALAINTQVQNRLQGMVYVKALNMLVLIPLAAFFVPDNYVHLFGVLPTHWIFQSVAYAAQSRPNVLFLFAGYIYLLTLLWFVYSTFLKKHFV